MFSSQPACSSKAGGAASDTLFCGWRSEERAVTLGRLRTVNERVNSLVDAA